MDTQGQALHAYRLSLNHPGTGEAMTFVAPLPEYFEQLLSMLAQSPELADLLLAFAGKLAGGLAS